MKSQAFVVLLVALLLEACADEVWESGKGAPPASASGGVDLGVSPRAPRFESKPLGPDEKRFFLFVVPGDASIEVDGRVAYRRSGVLELVGKVGDVRRVRVFKGARDTGDKPISLQAGGAVPAVLDLIELTAQVAGPVKKSKQVVFGDIDE